MSHNLNYDNPVVGMGCTVQTVNSSGGNTQGRVKTKSNIGTGHVVVNGFWQGDDV